MSQKKPITKEKQLNSFIWSLKGKCNGITEINAQLINQYCRFTIMAEDMSIKIRQDFDDGNYEAVEAKTKIYEKMNKLQLNLYKTLRFEQIKDKLAGYGDNPYITLMKEEAEEDGDL